MGKSKFIDKKACARFELLPKCSQDGEQIGGERVFIRVDTNVEVKIPGFEEARAENDEIESTSLPLETRKELLAMGFPDDEYNYMKHMRAIGAPTGKFRLSKRKVNLPTDVKIYDASEVAVQGTSCGEGAEMEFASVKKIQAPISLDSDLDDFIKVSDDDSGGSDMEDDFVIVASSS